MNLKELILKYAENDDYSFDRSSRLMIKRYNLSKESEKVLVNELFIDLCGYSLETLISELDKKEV